ncbi:MAG: peptidylprolyl isomerase [Acidobacteriota bacterium]
MRTDRTIFQRPRTEALWGRKLLTGAACALMLHVGLGSTAVAEAQQAAGAAPALPPAVQALPEVVAKINGNPISKIELVNQARSMRLQSIQSGNGDPGQSVGFLRVVLDALIGERLVYLDSEAREVGPTEGEVNERLQAIIETYGGEEGFTKALADQGIDRDYVRLQVRQTLSIDKVMEGEIKPEIQITDEEIQDYYGKFGNQMQVPATYRLRHILKLIPEGASDADKQALASQLEGLRTQIAGGADFAALAQQHTDDDRTREQGGEMPWIVFSGVEKGFEEAVGALTVGQLSGVVETRLGFHLLELLEKQDQRGKTLDEARNDIANILAVGKARAEIQRRVEQLRGQALIEILI